MSAAAVAFWSSVLLLGYIYIGYPLLIAARARLFPKPVRRGPFNGRYCVLLACYNEAANIRAKLESLLAQHAVAQLDHIHVGIDGATDGTAAAARALGDPRIVVHEFSIRRGKPAVINDLLAHAQSEILVLTDARQRVDSMAVERLLACFHDPDVGVVSGELVFEGEGETATGQGMGMYWKYEKWIRNNEGVAGSVPGATGALYAIRRKLLKPIPSDTLLDDVAYPMQAVMAGRRCVFEGGALVFDRPSRDPIQESVRKRRTIAGVFQLMRMFPDWLNPLRNPIWGVYVSHKVLRLASPWLLAAALAANLALADRPFYAGILAGQAIFYLAGLVGWVGHPGGALGRCVAGPMLFLTLNITTLAATWDAFRGRFQVAWRRSSERC